MSTNKESQPVPVFIKLRDGGSFKQKKTKEISDIIQELENELGPFAKGGVTIASGGDMFIRPTTTLQQEHLLSIKTVAKGTIPVSCALPKSHSLQRVVIRQVPTGDSIEEIHQALTTQGYRINHVHRFSLIKGALRIPSTTVALEFNGPAPQEIVLNSMVFRPEKQIPTPYRCKKCQVLGHTERYCTESPKCPNCGSNHEDMVSCGKPPHCVNCKGDHPASSPSCPQYVRWKTTARAAAEIEPQQQVTSSRSYSDATKTVPRVEKLNTEVEITKSQIEAIQTELAMLRTEIGRIKPLEDKVNSLDTAVKSMLDSLSFLENGQQSANSKLDKLALLMARMLPTTEEVGMDTEEPSPLGPSSSNSAQATPNKTNKQGPSDPKKRAINGTSSRSQK